MKRFFIGITGAIGAGKSSLSYLFSKAGYPVISADLLAREVVAIGSIGLEKIRASFGSQALLADGNLNRPWMRAEISRDPSLRHKLESITHPLIQAQSEEMAKEHFRKGAKFVFYEAPLLFEAASEKKMDKVICVHAPLAIRISRVMDRDGSSKEEVERLIASQLPQEEKMRRSDYLIENSGSKEELQKKADELLAKLNSSAPDSLSPAQ